MIKLLFLAGSTRKESCNKKLARAASEMAKEHGADVEFIDLADYEMPLYDGDFEDTNGLPNNALKLKYKFQEVDGFFIASPEYNSGYSGALKNTIDWLSRPSGENEARLSAFAGKVAAISATSPGGLGGLRGLVPLRMLLGNILVQVIPEQAALGDAYNLFNDKGYIMDDAKRDMVEDVVKSLVKMADKLKG